MTSASGICFVYYNQAGNNEYAVAPTIVEVVNGGLWSYSIYLPLVLRDN
jgi:hypothetical protein